MNILISRIYRISGNVFIICMFWKGGLEYLFKIALVGDVSIIYGEEIAYSPKLKEKFDGCDYRICNFEGSVVSNIDEPINKFGPTIRQSSNSVDILKELDINIACLANNHIYDYGYKSAKRTIELLDKSNIQHIGLCTEKSDKLYCPLVIEKKGVKVAIFNSAENGFGCSVDKNINGYAWLFSHILKEKITEYRRKCDYLVLVAHGGLENEPIPLPEWRQTYKDMIDLGVDAVVATHSHIVQAFEEYKGKPIYYSIGNFIFQEEGYDPRSQVVFLEFAKGKMQYSSAFVCYYRENRLIDLFCDEKFSSLINKYNCILLKEKDYLEYINKICLDIYSNEFTKYYAWGECIYDSPFRMRLLSAISLLIRGHKCNNTVKYHNIVVETNLWIAQRAIYILWSGNE